MKKYSFLLLAFLSVLAMSMTGCTDSVDYDPVGAVEGQGVYFPTTVATSYKVADPKGSIQLAVQRTNVAGAFEAPLNVSLSEGADQLFSVPSTVSFADGEKDSQLTITYNELVVGKKYQVTLAFPDSTPYSISTLKLNVVYSKGDGLIWEEVSNQAVYFDNIFSPYGVKNVKFTSVKVEKAKGKKMYRFVSPYDNTYFTSIFEVTVFPSDFEFPYIVLDGETYKDYDAWFIKATNLGFQMVDGVGPKFDPEWNTFGSVAGNLKTADGPIPPDSEQFPLGTFDEKSMKFDFGKLYHNLGGFGLLPLDDHFTLYLDPSKMEADFDTDYTWSDVEGTEGQFVSELANETKMAILQQAEEDQTFYRFQNLYEKGYHLYFNVNEEGLVTMPKNQETGLFVFNNPIYMEATPGKSSFDPNKNVIKLGVTFYLVDEDGKKSAELVSGIETFFVGGSELNLLQQGKKIDDYVGTWVVPAIDMKSGDKYQGKVSVTKQSDNKLAVRGLSFLEADYDDTAVLEYDSSTGLLVFVSQPVAPIEEGVPTVLGLLDPATFNVELDGSDKLIAGFSSDKTLQFFNDPMNSSRWNSMAYFTLEGGKIYSLQGLYNLLGWNKLPSTKSISLNSVAPAKMSLPAPVEKELQISLYKGKTTSKLSRNLIESNEAKLLVE